MDRWAEELGAREKTQVSAVERVEGVVLMTGE